ncbi:hypothetical protein SAMN06295967_11334 [Belliella buryatensis]|uniref:Uncharacterized protein n=1 Tax=Belliella buryatensis TaxID=1500549 RepID=A0A239FMG2_9BACT|nr:hypothetical protein [Belliella buryatensis]SNS57991.1 hypothetical protein SAMN06295967_11334 [Belliella buryatensis]
MGVDIYGRKPEIVMKRPKKIDYRSSTEDEKDEYYDKLEKWEAENLGAYFQMDCDGWRAIQILCDVVNRDYNLKIDRSYWDYNDGKGLSTQTECDLLADALELMLNDNYPKEFMEDDSNEIQVAMGRWNVTNNRKITSEEEAELNELYGYGTILWAPVVTPNGGRVESPYSCTLESFKEWIIFLRECGGFNIW